MRATIVIPLLGLMLLAAPGAAEDADTRRFVARFRADYSVESPLDVRQLAVDVVGASGRARGVGLLVDALRLSWGRIPDLRKDVEDAREDLRRFAEPIYRDLLRGGAVHPASLDRWDELRRAVGATATREAAEWDLVDRVVANLGGLLDSLADEAGHRALRDFVGLLRGTRSPELRARLTEALERVSRRQAAEALVWVLVTDADSRPVVAAALALGRRKSALAVEVLVERLAHADWTVRAAAAEALGDVGPAATAAIGPLVEMLEREVGRLREDAAAALALITGAELGPIPERWRAWMQAKAKGEEPPAFEEGDAAGATFYGIRTLSKRIVFVLDRSGSMRELANPADPDRTRTKLRIAKRELDQAVAGLADDGAFNVIAYHHAVERLDTRRSLVAADTAGRRALGRFLEGIDAVGATNIHDALESVFALAGLGASDRHYDVGLDTIFFLTDGNPTQGKIQRPDRILREVRRWNALRRIRIHVVAVGRDGNEDFLRDLAEQSGGQFVRR
jgi:HEAT repeat protein